MAYPEWSGWDEIDWRDSHRIFTEYMTQTFENADEMLWQFSDAQINQGLWYLAMPGLGEYIFDMLRPVEDESHSEIPWALRGRCLLSFYSLFETLFQKRCSLHLSHRLESGSATLLDQEVSPLNSICYMWYDIVCTRTNIENINNLRLQDIFLSVLEKTLTLDSEPCLEGALHGLGHCHIFYPDRVEHIIDQFLTENNRISADLRQYALWAINGQVR